ncbi:MAG TPA: hypothetical protein ENK85_09735 [Saprospiraceae bacterium]|nr:hypothetical protein [Saprospiraceae bacterium]
MLSLFNNTKLITAVFLVLYLVATRFYGFIHPIPLPENGGVLYELLVQSFGRNPLVGAIMGAILVFINAMILNRLVFERRIGYHRDYFVALIYILLSGSLLAFQTFSPYLVGSTFILFAIDRIFNLAKEAERRETDYYIGILLGIAGLMTPYYMIFVVPALLSMFLFGAFRLKEILALLLGWVNPILLAGVGYYMAGNFDYFWSRTFTFNYALYSLFNNWGWVTYGVLLVFIILFAVAVFIQPAMMTKQQHHAKQYIRVMYNFLFAAFGSLLFLRLSDFSYLFLMVLYLAFIYGVLIKRKNGEVSFTLELAHLVALILVMLNIYKFHLA